jgi:hypothetical protein
MLALEKLPVNEKGRPPGRLNFQFSQIGATQIPNRQIQLALKLIW